MKKKLALLLSGLVLFGSLAACGAPAATGTPAPLPSSSPAALQTPAPVTSATPSAKSGEDQSAPAAEKIAVYNIGVLDSTLDPHDRHTTGTVNFYLNTNAFLYRMNLDGVWEPELAEGYEVSEDGLTWTVKLKEGLKFSTGNPITADDVIFSWLRIMDPNYASEYGWIMVYIKGAQAFMDSMNDGAELGYEEAKAAVGLRKIDDLTVEVSLESATPFFSQLMGYQTYAIIDSKFCQEVGDPFDKVNGYGSTVEKTSTAGPFMITEWVQGEYVMAVKNPNYYDAGNVKLDGVRFMNVQSSATELNMYETGAVDLTNNLLTPADIQFYTDNGKLKSFATLETGWLGFNTTKAPFDDVRVRQALNEALDLNIITGTVMGGGTIPAIGITPAGMPSPANPSEPYVSEPFFDPEPNPELAKQLLSDAGYPDGQGFPADLNLSYGVTSDLNRAIAETMCAMWQEALNITITPDGQEAQARLSNREAQIFDITFQGWAADVVDPVNFLDTHRSGHFYNYGKWNSPEFDAAMKASDTAAEPERTEYLREAERILMADWPIIPYSVPTKSYLQSDRLVDVVASPLAIFDLKWADIAE